MDVEPCIDKTVLNMNIYKRCLKCQVKLVSVHTGAVSFHLIFTHFNIFCPFVVALLLLLPPVLYSLYEVRYFISN